MTSDFNDDDCHHDEGRDSNHDSSAAKKPEHVNANSSGAHDHRNAGPYEVGYGRPPKHSRVQKGQVLNPKGRPKGSKNNVKEASGSEVRNVVLNEAKRQVQLNDRNGPLTVTMLEAILRAQAVAAVKGNVRAQREFVAAARAAEREENADRGMLLAGVIEYKLAWEAEFRRRKEHGTKGPEPALHPDDLVLEEATGKVHIRGPATAEEGARWRSLRRTLRADLRDLEAQRDDPAHRKRGETSSDIERTEKVLSIVEKALAGSRRAMLVLEQALEED